ncbi:predicted protein [Phaeodactylum tricornutum CCAP 1055/1]|uniref:Integrase catalytic domain-containing protein n=1 Tax=Phaeodactylum tricornutum (strain CCAP 1055/1) TaxID=556484 RepID=B7GBI6_PHATC|nr:predicted protein [Phaeodactylum tricornutum CCAP 1055/1]EEC44126.1 predicted protein [Phaeodactylum tricornutum CCAP 1055/1]|eukprot:XP_002184377.1 predicted protein [Phaeodactylum tricornutum CCAP 1055/1]
MARVRKATGPTRKGATEMVPEERVEEETPFEAVESPSKDSDNETQPSSMGDDNDSQSEIESYKIDTDIDFKYNPNFFEDKKALESVLRNTMGFGDIHVKSLQNEGLKTANDFLLISMSDINDLCDKLLFATVYRARLRAFATWLRSQPDNINITQEWTIPVMQLEMQMKAQASPSKRQSVERLRTRARLKEPRLVIRHAGHQTDDIPKFLSQGKSLHGIETIDGDYIPFELKGRTSLLYSRVPTRHELENCLHIDLTSDQPWDPNSKDWEDNEQRYTRHDRQRNARYTATDNADEENFYHGYFSLPDSKEFPVLPANNNVMNPHDVVREIKYATARVSKSSPRDLDVDRDKLRRILGHVPMEVVDRTLEATTQLAERSGKMPLHRRFKTKFEQLRYRRLKCTLYSDTFKSTVKSSRGHTHTQGFVCGDSYFVYHFLMKAESEADQGLASIIQDIGIPAQIHTDNAKVETLSKWKKITSGHWIKVTVTEPYSPWQNRCEHEFGAVRIQTRLVMETTQCPEQLWDYAITYVVIVRNNTARKALNWQTPLTVMTGDTSDISELLDFEFYEPVQYFDNPEIKFPQAKAKVGRWLGIATNVGQAMCYYVLTDKGTVIARSTVTPLHKVDSTALQTSLTAFDAMIRDIYQPTDFAHSTKKQAASLRRDEAMKVARKTGEPEDPGVRNRHVLYDLNEGADHDQVEPGLSVDDYYGNDDEKESGSSDLLVGSEVLLTKGGIQHLGKVTKRDKMASPRAQTKQPIMLLSSMMVLKRFMDTMLCLTLCISKSMMMVMNGILLKILLTIKGAHVAAEDERKVGSSVLNGPMVNTPGSLLPL